MRDICLLFSILRVGQVLVLEAGRYQMRNRNISGCLRNTRRQMQLGRKVRRARSRGFQEGWKGPDRGAMDQGMTLAFILSDSGSHLEGFEQYRSHSH